MRELTIVPMEPVLARAQNLRRRLTMMGTFRHLTSGEQGIDVLHSAERAQRGGQGKTYILSNNVVVDTLSHAGSVRSVQRAACPNFGQAGVHNGERAMHSVRKLVSFEAYLPVFDKSSLLIRHPCPSTTIADLDRSSF